MQKLFGRKLVSGQALAAGGVTWRGWRRVAAARDSIDHGVIAQLHTSAEASSSTPNATSSISGFTTSYMPHTPTPTDPADRSSKAGLRCWSRSAVILLATLIGWQFFLLLGSAPLWDRDEPRNAGCSLEMLARRDWVVPTFNQELRGHKPVLLYWAQMPSLSWLGPNAWGARLPSALFGLVAVSAIGWLGSGLRCATTGWWAASAMATCLSVVIAARAGTPDAPLLACTTSGIAALALYRLKQNRWLWWLGYLAFGGAVLAKGPVGLILPAGCLILWSGLYCLPGEAAILPNRWRSVLSPVSWWRAIHWLNLPLGLVVVLAVSLPWFVLVGLRTDGAFLREFFLEHHVGRATRVMEGHRGGWWYYPAMLLVGTFPWSLMLIPIGLWLVHQWGKQDLQDQLPTGETARSTGHQGSSPNQALITLGLAWLVIYVFAFSLARTKLPSYITPAYPGAALLIGAALCDWSIGNWRLHPRWMWLASVVSLTVGICLAGIIIWLAQRQQMPSLTWQAAWAATLLIAAAGWSLAATGRIDQSRLPAVLLASYATLLGGLLSFGSAAAGSYRNDLEQLVAIKQQLTDSGVINTSWFSPDPVEPSWIFYLEQPIEAMVDASVPQADRPPSSPSVAEPPWVLRLRHSPQAVALITRSRLTDYLMARAPEVEWDKQLAESVSHAQPEALRTWVLQATGLNWRGNFRAFLSDQQWVVMTGKSSSE